MVLSKAAEHGLRLVLQLAASGPDAGYVTARSLARQCDVPVFYVGKICHRLTRAGILDSHKGPNGGVCLSRGPESLTLLEIVDALDGLEGFERCFLGLPFCGDEAPCPVHPGWKRIKQNILEMLSRRTLAEIAADVTSGRSALVSLGSRGEESTVE